MINNPYNPNPTTVDSALRQQQTALDLQRQFEDIPTEPTPTPQEPEKILGVEITPEYKGKSFLRKVGEDAAMLAYSIPVGLAQAVTHPIEFAKKLPGALVESVKETVDPSYYQAHPLLGLVNLAGFVSPISGVAKSLAIKTATKTAMNVALKEAVALGVEETTFKTALKSSVINNAIKYAAKTGKLNIVKEVIKDTLVKSGVAEDVALRVGYSATDNLFTTFSRQTTKMKVLESLSHPIKTAGGKISEAIDPLRKSVFGDPANSAIGRMFKMEDVAANPEKALQLEKWASMQVAENGLEDSVDARHIVMMGWKEKPRWENINTVEDAVKHFGNYTISDVARAKIHAITGGDYVTIAVLPKNLVESMVETVKAIPETDTEKMLQILDDNFPAEYALHSNELKQALATGATKENLINAITKLGDSKSLVTFKTITPELLKLNKEVEATGYRIGYAPKNKPISYASDILKEAPKNVEQKISVADLQSTRTAIGNFLDRMGLSPKGIDDSAIGYRFKENFNQSMFKGFADKHGDRIKIGSVTMPIGKVFDWIDKNRFKMMEARKGRGFTINTVFDAQVNDLITAGFKADIANDIVEIGKQARRELPASLVGLSDAVVNYLITSNNAFGKYASGAYYKYLQAAYKGRYDWSPFFSAQQYLETRLFSSMFLKDVRVLPGAGGILKVGDWTADKLGLKLGDTKTYLRDILAPATMEESALVKDTIFGNSMKGIMDVSNPDIMQIQNSAMGGLSSLKDKALFERSIRSRNIWYSLFGQSNMRMATNFNKALAYKFGMKLEDALAYTVEGGRMKFKNPEMAQLMKEATESIYHYKTGFLTSPLIKTLNTVWFPLRFQLKSVQFLANWMKDISPVQKMALINNWVHFANWAGTDEGIKWRRTNRNYLYNILAYTTAYEQLGQTAEAVTKGRLFGGNAGLIGGVPFGFLVNLARELAILPQDPDQFDPKTGKRFQKTIPRKVVSAAMLSTAIEQLIISMSPSTPFYSLTGGVIGGISPGKIVQSLTRQVVGATREAAAGRDPARGRQMLERDFKKVPLDYTRLAE